MKHKKIVALLAVVLVLAMLVGVLAACDDGKPKPYSGPVEYSYRMGPSDLPTSWNYHTYQSNSSTYVLDYASDTLYTFDYNDDFSGFVIVPSMASDYATDVTANYVGKYGVSASDVNKVWSIPLKSNLKFDNGDKIDANTFVESMKLLLDPKAANFRADNMWKSGDLKIFGSEAYAKNGTYGYSEIVSAAYGDDEYIDPAEFVADANGILQYNGKDIVLNIEDGGNWGSALSLYASYGYVATGYEMDEATGRVKIFDKDGEWILTRSLEEDAEAEDYLFYDRDGNLLKQRYVDEEANAWVYLDKDGNVVPEWAGSKAKTLNATYDPLAAAADEDGYVKLNASLLKNLQDTIAMLQGFDSVEAYAAAAGAYAYQEFEEMAFFGYIFDEMQYDGNVGFFAIDDNTLGVALINPMEDNFYLRYELCTSFFLVHPGKYKSCIKTEQGVYTNDYGTSVEKFIGYGPYKLTSYVADSTIILEKNDKWHGFDEDEYVANTYQTDKVIYTVVKDDAIRLEMFLKGELDSYGLQEKDMADYSSSNYLYYTDSESTWYLAMNPQEANLLSMQEDATPITAGNAVVKTVLAIDEFRQALSWSLDRQQFNLTLSPTSGVAKALLSSMIVADPETGVTYRDTDDGKDAILDFWGLADKWGEGKQYATRDDAIDSITGFDAAGAKVLFNKAFDIAKERGYISDELEASGKWEVKIVIGQPSAAGYYTKGYEFLSKNWTDAVKGTKFEGHLSFEQSQVLGSTQFGTYLRNGSIDLLFGVGYGGSMFNPYSMMDCFTGYSLQYDQFTDMKKQFFDIELDLGDGAKTYRASLYDWVSKCLQGDAITATIVDADGNATDATATFAFGSNTPEDLRHYRTYILAKCEAAIMNIANIFPIQTDASASLRCMRLTYKTENYIVGMGRGGIQYYTYTMCDGEFAQYVQSVGGKLNYK